MKVGRLSRRRSVFDSDAAADEVDGGDDEMFGTAEEGRSERAMERGIILGRRHG